MIPTLLAAAVLAGSQAPTRALIDQYCVSCHNEKTKAGGLALDAMDVTRAGENPEVCEKVVRKLRTRMMPPAGGETAAGVQKSVPQ